MKNEKVGNRYIIHTHKARSIVLINYSDNSIVAYRTGTERNIRLVLDTIREAIRKEKVTGELQLNSGQGFQYTSNRYFKLTQSYNIMPSMLRRGKPYNYT